MPVLGDDVQHQPGLLVEARQCTVGKQAFLDQIRSRGWYPGAIRFALET